MSIHYIVSVQKNYVMYKESNISACNIDNTFNIQSLQTLLGDEMEKNLISNVELKHLNDREAAIDKGPYSAMGKRKAYEILLNMHEHSFS